MKRLLLILGLAALLSVTAWSQEESQEPEEAETNEAAETAETAETDAEPEEDADDADLDEQGFADEDDDFRPSEEIPADQSIAFPTDI